MATNDNIIIKWMKRFFAAHKVAVIMASAAIVAVAIAITALMRSCNDSHIEMSTGEKIDNTPTMITSMKEIGEWEFLSIADEEMVDTIRKGIFSDDELIRIYYGTLRLGVDMGKMNPTRIKVEDDTVKISLPKIELLDEDFIDEARTKSFIETGKWSDKDREAMYRRAYIRMKSRCLTAANMDNAATNAERQIERMIKSFGYENVSVKFE